MITDNSTTDGDGGGIAALSSASGGTGTLTITNSTLSGNSAKLGGGLYNRGALTLSNSTLSGTSAYSGGGLYNATSGMIPSYSGPVPTPVGWLVAFAVLLPPIGAAIAYLTLSYRSPEPDQ